MPIRFHAAVAACLAVALGPAPARSESVDACTDFYTYVNQRWLQQTELPPDRARIGSFDALRIQSARLLEAALAEGAAAAAPQATPGDRKSTRLNSSHEWISRMPSSA